MCESFFKEAHHCPQAGGSFLEEASVPSSYQLATSSPLSAAYPPLAGIKTCTRNMWSLTVPTVEPEVQPSRSFQHQLVIFQFPL